MHKDFLHSGLHTLEATAVKTLGACALEGQTTGKCTGATFYLVEIDSEDTALEAKVMVEGAGETWADNTKSVGEGDTDRTHDPARLPRLAATSVAPRGCIQQLGFCRPFWTQSELELRRTRGKLVWKSSSPGH